MLLVVLIWGVNFSITKLALAQIPPLAFAALRFTSGSLLLWAVLRWREGAVPLPRGSLWPLIWIGVIGNTIYQVCFTLGLKYTTAANGSLIVAAVPALVAFFGALLGIERLTRNIAAGVLLALSGVVLVVMSRGLDLSGATLRGDLLFAVSAIAWTIYTLGVRSLGSGLSPLRITTLTMITGAPGLVLVAIPELLGTNWAVVSAGAWGGLAYAAVLSLMLAYALWNNSVRAVGSARTAIYGCAIPLVATLVAWPLLGEQPRPIQAAGAVLIIAGVLLTRRR